MVSERMLLPPWARSAARVLADKQMESVQRETSFHTVVGPGDQPAEKSEDGRETVGGTVSRKGKFGYVCDNCPHKGSKANAGLMWKPMKISRKGWLLQGSIMNGGTSPKLNFKHFPVRCRQCRSKMRRWTNASNGYKQLDLLRQIEGRPNLKFVTMTRKEWSIRIPFDQGFRLWEIADELKKRAYRQARNWRSRNTYWRSREAKGMIYPECKVTPIWPFDEIKLHFHMHMIVCSKRIENQDIQIDLDTLEPIPMSTTIQREWAGIVDTRKCRTWKHKDGEIKTSRRFVMNYLLDYINKAAHWQSSKFGDWSS